MIKEKKNYIAFIILLISSLFINVYQWYNKRKKVRGYEKHCENIDAYYDVCRRWLELRQTGRNLSEYFEKHGYRNIAIYGMGNIGNRVFDEFVDSNVNVVYCVDKNPSLVCTPFLTEVYGIDEPLPEVDVIVVAVFTYSKYIYVDLNRISNSPIIRLDEIID